MLDKIQAIAGHLPGAWRVRGSNPQSWSMTDGEIEIVVWYDDWKASHKLKFSVSVPSVLGRSFVRAGEMPPRIFVSAHRSAEAIAADIQRRLLSQALEYRQKYVEWRDLLLAHHRRQEGNKAMLLQVSDGAACALTHFADMIYGKNWSAQISSESIEIRCRVDAETAAEIIEILRKQE